MIQTFITELNGEITGLHGGNIKAKMPKYQEHNRIIVPDDTNIIIGDRLEYYDSKWNRKSDLQLIKEGLISVPEGYILEDGILRFMTIVERINSRLDELPEGYLIDGNDIRLMTKGERINAGLDELPIGYKIENGQVFPMTLIEKINAGINEIPKGFKIENNEIIPMSRVERIEAALELLPTGYKIENDQIIPLTQIERIKSGLDELPIGCKIDNDQIIEMTQNEKLEAGIITQEEIDAEIAERNLEELRFKLSELQTPEALALAEIDEEYATMRKIKIKTLLDIKKHDELLLKMKNS